MVRDGSLLGVVAEREELAIKARDALIGFAKWSGGLELPDAGQLYAQLLTLPAQTSVVNEKQTTAARR